jgi:hypothetical protein
MIHRVCNRPRVIHWLSDDSFSVLHCGILLHCVDLSLRFAFMPSMCYVSYYSLVAFLHCHYMFRPNRPSSGAQVVMIKESAFHCNAYVVASDCFCLCGLTICYDFGVLELYMFALSVICDVLDLYFEVHMYIQEPG